MKLLLRRPLVFGFLSGIVIPVSLIGLVQTAVDRGALSVDISWRIVWGPFNWLLAPGDALLEVLGLYVPLLTSHTTGWLFWSQFLLLFAANWIGWTGIAAILQALLSAAQGRSSDSDTGTEPTSGACLLPWIGAAVWSGVVGVGLPLLLQGLLILARGGPLTALLQEGGFLVFLLRSTLLPGEGALFLADQDLTPFSGLSQGANFWVSSTVLLLVNWALWMLLFGVVLPRVRSALR